MGARQNHNPNLELEAPHTDIETLIGEGTQSYVYRGLWKKQPAVVKVQKKNNAANVQNLQTQFFREAVCLARVAAPLSPKIFDVGVSQSRAYLIEELIEGTPLRDLLDERKTLDETTTVRIGMDLASCLQLIHRKNYVHRDLNPRNILIGKEGRSHLIDFGLADARTSSFNSEVVGTLAYVSPEQTGLLQRGVDHRSDLYSLGVTLYECLFGRPPFVETDPGRLIHAQVNEVAKLPQNAETLCSEKLRSIILSLLAKDPDDRYQSAQALLKDLSTIGSIEQNSPVQLGKVEVTDSVFVGRNEQMEALAKHWELTREKSGQCVVVEAPSGIGKTKLVQQFVALQVKEQAKVVLFGKATKTESPLPFAAFREAFSSFLEDFFAPDASSEQDRKDFQQICHQHWSVLVSLIPKLRAVVEPPASASETSSTQLTIEQFYSAVSDFLFSLSEKMGTLFICLDDIQWLDEASISLLRVLSQRLKESQVMLTLLCRHETESESKRLRIYEILGQHLDRNLQLQNFSADEVREMTTKYLGNLPVSSDALDFLVSRSECVPFALVQLLDLLLGEGALRPSEGTWKLHRETAQSLKLPHQLVDLVTHRLEQISPDSRRLLECASLWGARFPVRLIAEASENAEQQLLRCLQETLGGGFVEQTETDGILSFAHDRVQEALLLKLDEKTQAQIHTKLAQAMRKLGLQDQYIYEFAEHLHLSDQQASQDEYMEAYLQAARKAQRDFAVAQAYQFFTRAESVASGQNGRLLTADLRNFAVCTSLLGKHNEALQKFDDLLQFEKDPMERAKAHYEMGRISNYRREIDKAWHHTTQGLVELGFWVQGPRWIRLLWTFYRMILGLLIDAFNIEWMKPKDPKEIEKLKLTAVFTEMGGVTAYFLNDPWRFTEVIFPSVYVTSRLPICTERALAEMAFATGVSVLGLRGLAVAYETKSMRISEIIKDPYVSVRSALYRVFVLQFTNRWTDARLAVMQMMQNQIQYLDGQDMMNATFGGMACMTVLSGHLQEGVVSWEVARSYQARFEARKEMQTGHPFLSSGIDVMAEQGEFQKSEQQKKDIQALVENHPDDRCGRLGFYGSTLAAHYFTGFTGPEVDDLIQRGRSASPFPGFLGMPHFRFFFVFSAYVLLNRLLITKDPTEYQKVLKDFKKALSTLFWNSILDSWKPSRAHIWVLRAALAVHEKKWKTARRALRKAELIADRFDLPFVHFEVLRWRAFMLKETGQEKAALRSAKLALGLARQYDWPLRIDAISREFKLVDEIAGATLSTSLPTESYSPDTSTGQAPKSQSLQKNKQFQALVNMSRRAVGVFDQTEQARNLLDETISYFGSGRALLFLVDEKSPDPSKPQLKFFFGRTQGGEDINEAKDISNKAVQQAAEKRRALIMTIDEAMQELGSQSVVSNNIRSVLSSPLVSRNQMLGVLYMDNHLIRGVFRESDREFVESVSGIFASSLESSRAARLEMDKASMQRDLELTGMVQRLLLPTSEVMMSNQLHVHGYLKPATDSSGDIWWSSEIAPGLVFAFIGDVTGHGPAAAMVTARVVGAYQQFLTQLKAESRSNDFTYVTTQISQFLSIQDRALNEMASESYLMPFSGVLMNDRGNAAFWAGGFPGQFVRLPGETKMEFLENTNNPLGLKSKEGFQVKLFDGFSGDFLLFSDGLLEAIPTKGNPEMALKRALDKVPQPEQVIDALKKLVPNEPAPDDITFVQIRLSKN